MVGNKVGEGGTLEGVDRIVTVGDVAASDRGVGIAIVVGLGVIVGGDSVGVSEGVGTSAAAGSVVAPCLQPTRKVSAITIRAHITR